MTEQEALTAKQVMILLRETDEVLADALQRLQGASYGMAAASHDQIEQARVLVQQARRKLKGAA